MAIGSITKLGAAVGAPVMIKTLRFKHTAGSLLAAVLAGLASAYGWDRLGYGGFVNEAAIGLACSLLANRVAIFFANKKATPKALANPLSPFTGRGKDGRPG